MSLFSPLVIKDNIMGVKLEKIDENGTKNNPVIIAPFRNGSLGSKSEPICLEDDLETLGDCKTPISVDDYECKELSLIDLDCFEVDPVDPKGKKPVREPGSRRKRTTLQVGECSNSKSQVPDSYCSICMEPKFTYECFGMMNCSHSYCTSCVSQYVEAKVEDNVTTIGCPDPSCENGVLELEMCRHILKVETYHRWGNALCENMIGAMKFYCPFEDCSALLIDESEGTNEVITQSECPHCYRLFCAQCRVPWHMGVTCEEFVNLGADERGREDILLKIMAQTHKWQRCPKCGYYVERTEGCMFIKCRCGHQFCYGCATEMTVDHYCKHCRR